ncbi:hypothetical protein Pcinc_029665 [Petrolisthes cinctipes]|uniref:Uncharacterized protein n=1 Tax=Petrolisthes cinctipes TaxID=88211 RepID=A0AAE1EZM2_PETCI|nr:hypothetical protein Pcinc_029665 [Petrolisthes cinctipes]
MLSLTPATHLNLRLCNACHTSAPALPTPPPALSSLNLTTVLPSTCSLPHPYPHLYPPPQSPPLTSVHLSLMSLSCTFSFLNLTLSLTSPSTLHLSPAALSTLHLPCPHLHLLHPHLSPVSLCLPRASRPPGHRGIWNSYLRGCEA